jgi:hypothetical protein
MTGQTRDPMNDAGFDRELQRLLEWDVSQIDGAPSLNEMIDRLAPLAGRRRAAPRWWFATNLATRTAVVLALLAALIAGALAAGSWWNRQNSVVILPSATIGPTARPLAGQAVDQGSWYLDIDFVRITVDIPDGWQHSWIDTLNWLQPPTEGPALWLATTVENVLESPCGAPRSPEIGPSVDDLATALAELPGLDATAPVDATVSGYSGKTLTLTAPASLAGCTGNIGIWLNADLASQSYLDFGEVTSIWILDVEGTRLVLRTIVLPTTTTEEQVATQAIFDSTRLEPRFAPPATAEQQ